MNFTINVIPDLLNFSLSIITTLILYLGLRHFLFKPVTNMIEKRKNYIEENIIASESKLTEAEKLKEEYSERLSLAGIEAKSIVSEARKNYDVILTSAKADADTEKQKIISSAEKEAALIKDKALTDLKDKIIDIAILAAKDVSKSGINIDEAKSFTDKKIQELSAVKWEK